MFRGNPYCDDCEDYELLIDIQRREVAIAEIEVEQNYGHAALLTALRQAERELRNLETDYSEHRMNHVQN